jgi:alpha/beta hydrolase fold
MRQIAGPEGRPLKAERETPVRACQRRESSTPSDDPPNCGGEHPYYPSPIMEPTRVRRALFAFLLLLLLPLQAADSEPLWQTLPPTPAPVAGEHTGYGKVNGISLFYATIGHGSPVVLLHGGLSNSDYWGNQIKALAPHHTVIVVDSRGHGRSTRDARPYGYDLMADDVVALLDTLHIAKADVVGWSNGAILGLDLAIRYPDRVGKVNHVVEGLTDIAPRFSRWESFVCPREVHPDRRPKASS